MAVRDPLPRLELECIQCGATWRQGEDQHYVLHLGQSGRPHLIDVEPETVDTWLFCTLACLAKWSKMQKVDPKVEHNRARAAVKP
jgi:hypothetical protein